MKSQHPDRLCIFADEVTTYALSLVLTNVIDIACPEKTKQAQPKSVPASLNQGLTWFFSINLDQNILSFCLRGQT